MPNTIHHGELEGETEEGQARQEVWGDGQLGAVSGNQYGALY